MVVIIRDETKRIVLNISTTANKIYNEWVKCAVFFTPVVTLDFILHKELVIFSEIPKNNHFICFQEFFLGFQKISWQLAKNECYGIYADIKVSLYSSQVDKTVTREALSVVCHCE